MNNNELCFGELLKRLIRDAGMTQTQFYCLLGIKKPYFYEIVSGRVSPPPYPLQFKALEILNADEKTKILFFDKAAQGRNELPADVAMELSNNPQMINSIREKITSQMDADSI